MAGKRVFVAGATGVIGRALLPRLVAAGHDVVGMTRSTERAVGVRACGARAVICDALDAPALTEAVREASPEVVIHELTDIPANLEPRKYKTQLAGTNRLRSEGTRNLVAAAQAAGAGRLIAQSIAFAYKPVGGWIKDETAPLDVGGPAPMDAVIGAVAELEAAVLAAGGLVMRYGFFYGPGTQFARDGYYAKFARWRLFPVIGSGAGTWSFIHVDDAADATVAAVEHGDHGIYNIVDDDPAPAREWVPVFTRALGFRRPLRVPAFVVRLGGGAPAVAAMTVQRGAGNAKAKQELGWTPAHASWRDGFSATGL